MNRLKTIIVDDERLARRGLALRLEQFEQMMNRDAWRHGF